MTLPVIFKYKNGENPERNCLNTKEVNVYVCSVCGKNFYREISWRTHVNSHNINNNNNNKLEDGNVQREVLNTCNLCLKKFTAKKNLLKHLREVHKNFSEAQRMMVKKIKCPENNCEFLCRMMKDLREHIEQKHKIKILKDTLQFPNETMFKKWKNDEESNTASRFVTGRKKTTLMDGTKKQTLYCHRTGHYNPKGLGKYKMRSTGSCKIGVTCPAAMEVVESPDGWLTVIYYKTHLGHMQDVIYLKLSTEERADLAEKIKQGFSFDAILDDVKESQDNDQEKKKRIHLLSKKDLYSIMRTSNCNNKRTIKKEDDDAINESAETEQCEITVKNSITEDSIRVKKTEEGTEQRFNTYHSDEVISTLKRGDNFMVNQNFVSLQMQHRDLSSIPQTSREEITSQIVILSPDFDYSSVAEIIFLPAVDATITQSAHLAQTERLDLESCSIHKTESKSQILSNVIIEEKNKINKSNLHLQVKEKLEKISSFLPQTDYLTPKQFELINAKLDRVLDIFNVANAKANARKQSSKKKVITKTKVSKSARKINGRTEYKTKESLQLHENSYKLYAAYN